MEFFSYWGHNIDLKYSRGRANSTFREESDEMQFGVGRKVGPGYDVTSRVVTIHDYPSIHETGLAMS